ncbi:MAG: 50S ribosomal protein L31 [Planctomycetes bacterium]|nr:50S ribosomal protein L31 [Planctomycetota bacterium]
MQKGIHPVYKECVVKCGCGETFVTRSTKEKILIEVCSKCHPFYTGKQKFVDTAGMVEKFQRKYNWGKTKGAADQPAAAAPAGAAPAAAAPSAPTPPQAQA